MPPPPRPLPSLADQPDESPEHRYLEADDCQHQVPPPPEDEPDGLEEQEHEHHTLHSPSEAIDVARPPERYPVLKRASGRRGLWGMVVVAHVRHSVPPSCSDAPAARRLQSPRGRPGR